MTASDAYLLDTNFVSALWDSLHQKHHVAVQLMQSFDDSPVYVSVVSMAEIEYGLKTAPRIDEPRQRKVRQNMAKFPLRLEITRHTVPSYAQLRASAFKRFSPRNRRGRLTAKVPEELLERTSGKELGISENDLWLAAQAVERNLVLVSDDRMYRICETCSSLRFLRWLGRPG